MREKQKGGIKRKIERKEKGSEGERGREGEKEIKRGRKTINALLVTIAFNTSNRLSTVYTCCTYS